MTKITFSTYKNQQLWHVMKCDMQDLLHQVYPLDFGNKWKEWKSENVCSKPHPIDVNF